MQPTLFLFLLYCWSIPGITADVEASYDVVATFLEFSSASLAQAVLPAYSIATVTRLNATLQVDACIAGYYSYDDAQTCTACVAGKYSGTYTAPTVDTCIPCESGKYSTAIAATASSTCKDCPAGTYFEGTGGQALSVCLACPANSSSYNGSKLLQSCICNPGYQGPNGGPCSACNTSVWCLFGRANPCPPNSKSAAMSSSLAQCLCNPSYYGDTTVGGAELTLCQVRFLSGFCLIGKGKKGAFNSKMRLLDHPSPLLCALPAQSRAAPVWPAKSAILEFPLMCERSLPENAQMMSWVWLQTILVFLPSTGIVMA